MVDQSPTVSRPSPKEFEVVVSGLTDDGLGIAAINDRPFHVRNALPGETVQARLLRKRKGLRYGDGVAVLDAAHTDRTTPVCGYFPRCGGCSLQHMAYDFQLRHKENQIREALGRCGIEPGRWADPVSTGEHSYRRKARLGVRVVGGEVLVGFRESFSNRVARMTRCETLSPELGELVAPLRETIGALSEPDKIPQIELAQGDRGVVIIVRHLNTLTPADAELWGKFADQHNVEVLSQSGGYETVQGLTGLPVPKLHYQLESLRMEFDPRQFTQVNADMNARLVATALEYLHPLTDKDLIDLFCGIGNFSLPLAYAGASVLGVEFSNESVHQAQLNAEINGLAGVEFSAADLYKDSQFLELKPNATALLLDPPRSGAGPLLTAWLQKLTHLEEIIYVSCKPQSFAEDVLVMEQIGFRLVEVGAYDMFPQTAHVETIGYLQRR
ncbi:MAG: 23S rRNA (uracil(1939)-C(5))-methyltransferase RlmD [Pseudomonadales bacterium]|nr:23S rRNA (uracil(1939)-C(5))-methyltransferase RlmD [Pseudomonadales bacterium]